MSGKGAITFLKTFVISLDDIRMAKGYSNVPGGREKLEKETCDTCVK
jgi:hypothetical protein